MLFVIAIAIIIGWSRGGRLANLTEIRVRIWWLLFIGFGLQAVALFLPSERHDLAVALILASYGPLLLFVWLNRRMAGTPDKTTIPSSLTCGCARCRSGDTGGELGTRG